MQYFVHQLLQLYIYVIIADILMSYIPEARKQKWAQVLHKIADAPQKPIREMLPENMPLDPTPMIIIILIQMLMYLL
jgi:YggT family protein